MLYTDKIQDEKIAALIRGIRPVNGPTPFATSILTSDVMMDSPLVFYTASSRYQSWNVKEITAFPNGDDFDIQQKTIHSNIHFFDALHFCAEKQSLQLKMGKREVRDDVITEKLMYGKYKPWQDVAKESGQPLDTTGMPLPAGNGEILVDGLYSSGALKLADETKNRPIRPDNPKTPSITNSFPKNTVASNSERFDELRKKSGVVANFTRALHASQGTLKAIKKGSETDFKIKYDDKVMDVGVQMIFCGVGAALTLVLSPFFLAAPIGLRVYNAFRYPNDKINIASLQANTAAMLLPEGPEKQMVQEFNKLARATHHLERAASHFDAYRDNHTKLRDLSRAVKCAKKGLTMMDTSAEDIDRVVTGMYKGDFPHKGHFHNTAQHRFGEVQKKLSSLTSLEYKPYI